MKISCPICFSSFENEENLVSTPCGHIFHNECINKWFENKHSCPQCRARLSPNKIVRLFLTVSDFNSTQVDDNDSKSLLERIENLTFQIGMKDQTIKDLEKTSDEISRQAHGLRNEVRKLESNISQKETAIFALKDQCKYFKSLSKDVEKYKAEAEETRKILQTYKNIQLIITGLEAEAKDVIENSDPKNLSIYLGAMKRELVTSKQKRQDLALRHKGVINQNIDLRKKVENMSKELENKERTIQTILREKVILSSQIKEKEKPKCLKDSNSSVDEVIFFDDSKPNVKVSTATDLAVKKSEEHSPYLRLKVNNYDKPKRKLLTIRSSSESTSNKKSRVSNN